MASNVGENLTLLAYVHDQQKNNKEANHADHTESPTMPICMNEIEESKRIRKRETWRRRKRRQAKQRRGGSRPLPLLSCSIKSSKSNKYINK